MCLVLVEFSVLVSQLCCEINGDLMADLTNVTDDTLPQEQEILQPEFEYRQMHVLQQCETGGHFVKYLCMLDVFCCIA